VFALALKPTGLLRFAVLPQRDQVLTDLAAATLTQALAEYASGRMPRANARMRFEASAFSRQGFLPRSNGYTRRQMRMLGRVLPYVSPRRANLAGVALSLAKAARSPNAGAALGVIKAISKAMAPRMRDLVLRPGIGHRIMRSAGRRRVLVSVSWPGARVLNRQGGTHAETYRRQWANLANDWPVIRARAEELYNQALATIARGAA
jgi:hypothetical protein